MNNCLFCKISSGDIPCVKLYEDNDILVFLDISQTTKGHTLVIPKKHFENLMELDEETITKIYKQIPRIARAIMNAFNAKGMNIINNNGEIAGQTVFHYHVHLIPRYNEDDGLRVIYTNHMDKYSKEDLELIANTIQKNI